MSISPRRHPSGRRSLQNAILCHDSASRPPSLDASRHRGLESGEGVVFWCSNGSAVEPGEGQMGNVG